MKNDNGIFIFLKIPIKRRTKKNIIASDTFFIFYFVFKKKIKKTKIRQKLSKKVRYLSFIFIYSYNIRGWSDYRLQLQEFIN
jgi:hypothetical protein